MFRVKALAIEHHLSRIRSRGTLTASALDADEDLRDIVLVNLQQAIQNAIDLAVHICSHEALGLVETPGAAFALLANARIIAPELSRRLSSAGGLRNLIVHRYSELLMEKVAAAIANDLGDLEAFVGAIRAHAANP